MSEINGINYNGTLYQIGGGSLDMELFASLLEEVLTDSIYESDQSENITALIKLMRGEPVQVLFSVTNNLVHVTNSNTDTTVMAGGSYSGTLTAESGYELDDVKCSMGGVVQPVVNGVIFIPRVTGNIVITANAETTGTVLYKLASPTVLDGTNHIDTGVTLAGDYTSQSAQAFSVIAESTIGNVSGDMYLYGQYCSALSVASFYLDLYNGSQIYSRWFTDRKNKGLSTASVNDVIRSVYTKDVGGNPSLYISINGNLVVTIDHATAPTGAILSSEDHIFIGKEPSTTANKWIGTVNSFKILNRALSSNEITAFLEG